MTARFQTPAENIDFVTGGIAAARLPVLDLYANTYRGEAQQLEIAQCRFHD